MKPTTIHEHVIYTGSPKDVEPMMLTLACRRLYQVAHELGWGKCLHFVVSDSWREVKVTIEWRSRTEIDEKTLRWYQDKFWKFCGELQPYFPEKK